MDSSWVSLTHTMYNAATFINMLMTQAFPHVGEYKLSNKTVDFNGWLLCDGRSLSRETHKALFDAIGTTYGATDADTFNLPDFRDRVIGQPGINHAMGSRVGAEQHTLTRGQMPPHTHTGTVNEAGTHSHTAVALNNGSHTHAITDPGHSHIQTTTNDDFNGTGSIPPSFAADAGGPRTWDNIAPATTGVTVNASGVHSHEVSVDGSGAHTHTFVTDSDGSGQPHNNMQPTIFGANVYIYGGYIYI